VGIENAAEKPVHGGRVAAETYGLGGGGFGQVTLTGQ